MSQALRIVSSVKASAPEVWAALARAQAFVVSPYASLHARFDREAELLSGCSVVAKLVAGPLALGKPWLVQTTDRDADRLAVKGAEGFDNQLLWDYEVLLAETGPRCILDYRVRLPGKRSTPWGICIERMFGRRHINLRSSLALARGNFDGEAKGSPLQMKRRGAR